MKSTNTSGKMARPPFKVLRPSPAEEASINYKDIPKMRPRTKLVRTSLEKMEADWQQWMAKRKTDD